MVLGKLDELDKELGVLLLELDRTLQQRGSCLDDDEQSSVDRDAHLRDRDETVAVALGELNVATKGDLLADIAFFQVHAGESWHRRAVLQLGQD